MHATLALIAALCVTVAPVRSRAAARLSDDSPPRVLYDQRQEGGWNVRADLKNFVVVIIPKAAEPQEPGLLDLLTRAHRPPTSAHFIQSKTAPYHVDISKASSSHLRNDEILATQSPPPPELRRQRSAKAFVLTVPEEQFIVVPEMEDARKVVKKSGEEMALLGAVEQCGPDMARDAEGVCRLAH